MPNVQPGSKHFYLDVVTRPTNRRFRLSKLDPAQLAATMREFTDKIETVISGIPATNSGFQLSEFEVSAEVNAKGQLALLGTGGELGGSAGMKFVFRRKP